MNKDIERKNYMLRVAARYLREKVNDLSPLIEYDGTECDGECVATDCEFAADEGDTSKY